MRLRDRKLGIREVDEPNDQESVEKCYLYKSWVFLNDLP